MAIYDKLNKTISNRDVDACLDLIHEGAVFVFHKSGDKFSKTSGHPCLQLLWPTKSSFRTLLVWFMKTMTSR